MWYHCPWDSILPNKSRNETFTGPNGRSSITNRSPYHDGKTVICPRSSKCKHSQKHDFPPNLLPKWRTNNNTWLLKHRKQLETRFLAWDMHTFYVVGLNQFLDAQTSPNLEQWCDEIAIKHTIKISWNGFYISDRRPFF